MAETSEFDFSLTDELSYNPSRVSLPSPSTTVTVNGQHENIASNLDSRLTNTDLPLEVSDSSTFISPESRLQPLSLREDGYRNHPGEDSSNIAVPTAPGNANCEAGNAGELLFNENLDNNVRESSMSRTVTTELNSLNHPVNNVPANQNNNAPDSTLTQNVEVNYSSNTNTVTARNPPTPQFQSVVIPSSSEPLAAHNSITNTFQPEMAHPFPVGTVPNVTQSNTRNNGATGSDDTNITIPVQATSLKQGSLDRVLDENARGLLVDKLDHAWQDFASKLGMLCSEIELIEKEHPGDVKSQIKEMLNSLSKEKQTIMCILKACNAMTTKPMELIHKLKKLYSLE